MRRVQYCSSESEAESYCRATLPLLILSGGGHDCSQESEAQQLQWKFLVHSLPPEIRSWVAEAEAKP